MTANVSAPDIARIREVMSDAYYINEELSVAPVLRSSVVEDSQPGRDHPPRNSDVEPDHWDSSINHAFAEISRLKKQIVAYDTLDLFEQRIIRGRVEEIEDSLREDALVREAKTALKTVKDERRKLYEVGLGDEVSALVDDLTNRDAARDTLSNDLDDVLTVSNARHLEHLLFTEGGSKDAIRRRSIVEHHAGDMSLSTCERLLEDLRVGYEAVTHELAEVTERLNARTQEMRGVRSGVDSRCKTVNSIVGKVQQYEAMSGTDAAELRVIRERTSARRETGRYLRALSGLGVKEMRPYGSTLIVDTLLHSKDESGARERASHILDVVFDPLERDDDDGTVSGSGSGGWNSTIRAIVTQADGTAENSYYRGKINEKSVTALFHAVRDAQNAGVVVSDVVLEPCDVQLDARGVSLEWVTRLVVPELRRATYDRMATMTATTSAVINQ